MYVLLSIKPEYAEAILNGKKKYEYRNNVGQWTENNVKKVYLYVTKPVQEIIGWFTVKRIRFFEIGDTGGGCYKYTIEIDEVHKFKKNVNPFVVFNNFRPPQSWIYCHESIEGITDGLGDNRDLLK